MAFYINAYELSRSLQYSARAVLEGLTVAAAQDSAERMKKGPRHILAAAMKGL